MDSETCTEEIAEACEPGVADSSELATETVEPDDPSDTASPAVGHLPPPPGSSSSSSVVATAPVNTASLTASTTSQTASTSEKAKRC